MCLSWEIYKLSWTLGCPGPELGKPAVRVCGEAGVRPEESQDAPRKWGNTLDGQLVLQRTDTCMGSLGAANDQTTHFWGMESLQPEENIIYAHLKKHDRILPCQYPTMHTNIQEKAERLYSVGL